MSVGKIFKFFFRDKKKKEEENELWFITLGPSGAGKTSLLACMHRLFESSALKGVLLPEAEGLNNTFQALSESYEKLEEMGNNNTLISVAPLVEGTEDERQHVFYILGENERVRIRFFDYPGFWMNPYAKNPTEIDNNDRIVEYVQKSMVIFVVINTPYLMEQGGKFKEYAKIKEIEHFLGQSIDVDQTSCAGDYEADKLVLFVPVKCEKYMRTPEDIQSLIATVKNNFKKTIDLAENSTRKNRLALAILPVQTTGNVEFSRFEYASEMHPPTQKYARSGRDEFRKFKPRYAEQPFRYAMNFLLNQYNKKRELSSKFGILNSLFGRDNLKMVSPKIREGMREDIENGFEIIRGHDLIR